MIILVFLLCFLTLTTVVFTILYFRQTEGKKLECMALKNLLTPEETSFYISEYKKILVSKIIFEHTADQKDIIEVVREVVKSRRDK